MSGVTVAMSLAGTDCGRSGIGTFIRMILPRLGRTLETTGGRLLVMGTPQELRAYRGALGTADVLTLASGLDRPGVSALWHLFGCGRRAARAGADVLLLPAANRRLSIYSPIPTVAVVHDLAQLVVPGKYDKARMFYVTRVVIAALRRATRLVAVSGATREHLCDALGVTSDGVRVVLNGVDSERFCPERRWDGTVDRARHALSVHEQFVLYAARLVHPVG